MRSNRHHYRHRTCGFLAAIVALTAAGCATHGPTPLTSGQLSNLSALSMHPKQAGIKIKTNGKGESVLDQANQVPLGAKTEIDFVESKSSLGGALALVRAGINDKTVYSLIDTGSSLSLIDYYAANRTRLNPLSNIESFGTKTPQGLIAKTAMGIGNDGEYFVAVANTVQLGPLRVYKVPLGIVNDRRGIIGYGWIKGQRVESIIGNDLLSSFKHIKIDFPNQQLSLNASGKYRPDPTRILATVPLHVRNGIPTVPARINGKGPILVALDTGADFGLWIPRGIGEKLGLGDGSAEFEHVATGFGGEIAYKNVAPSILNLGGFEFEEVPTQVSAIRMGTADPDFAFLGMKVLQHYSITIDYDAKKIYFEKP